MVVDGNGESVKLGSECFFLKLLFMSCKDSISLFVYKSNRWSQGDKRSTLPLMDTQKHESICILIQHTHTTQTTQGTP